MHGVEVCGVQVKGQSESERILVVRSGVIHGVQAWGHMKQAWLTPLYEWKRMKHVYALGFWSCRYGGWSSPIYLVKIKIAYIMFFSSVDNVDYRYLEMKLSRGPHWVRTSDADCPSLIYSITPKLTTVLPLLELVLTLSHSHALMTRGHCMPMSPEGLRNSLITKSINWSSTDELEVFQC